MSTTGLAPACLTLNGLFIGNALLEPLELKSLEHQIQPLHSGQSHRISGLRQCMIRQCITQCILMMLLATSASVQAAPSQTTLVLEKPVVQRALDRRAARNKGRLYLQSGQCYAYVTKPVVNLLSSRITIAGHLTAKIGAVVEGQCFGLNVSTGFVLSGIPQAKGSKIALADVQIDHFSDPNLNSLKDIASAAITQLLPRATTFDVRPLIEKSLGKINGWSFTLESVVVGNPTVTPAQIDVPVSFRVRAH